jgi:toxin FitB
LLDTNVVSEFRRTKPQGAVIAWLQAQEPNRIFVAAATIGELRSGIEITREQSRESAVIVESWLKKSIGSHSVKPMDHHAFRAWARVLHHKSDQLIGNALIGATAIANGLTVASRYVATSAAWALRSAIRLITMDATYSPKRYCQI